jgi:hypothetical protein
MHLGSLVPDLKITRRVNRIPLVSVTFGYYKMFENRAKFQHLQSQFSVNARTSENFEIYCSTIEEQGEVTFETQYNTDLFEQETIARWMKALEVLLSAVAENADRPIMSCRFLAKQNGNCSAAGMKQRCLSSRCLLISFYH